MKKVQMLVLHGDRDKLLSLLGKYLDSFQGQIDMMFEVLEMLKKK